MPISNLVESAVNLAENVTGADIDRDGDIGVRGTSTTVMLCLSPLTRPPCTRSHARTHGSYRRHS